MVEEKGGLGVGWGVGGDGGGGGGGGGGLPPLPLPRRYTITHQYSLQSPGSFGDLQNRKLSNVNKEH